jgi:hypothetical protein
MIVPEVCRTCPFEADRRNRRSAPRRTSISSSVLGIRRTILGRVFSYDVALLAAVRTPVATVPDVLYVMQTVDNTCVEGDGLKWFNWLYSQVTQSVETRIAAGGFASTAWLSTLDVEFAQLYFSAVAAFLQGRPCPGCWNALFLCRDQRGIARIQFALAGINAHINHDLPQALVATATISSVVPEHGIAQYNDYTALNSTFDSLITTAKKTLHVRLLGDPLPAVSHLEETIPAWDIKVAREQAWTNSEVLWSLRGTPSLAKGFMDTLDGLTTVAGKALLVPAPQM